MSETRISLKSGNIFTPLDNDYYTYDIIENEIWKSTSHYIFSKLLFNPGDKILLKKSPSDKLESLVNQYNQKYIEKNIIQNLKTVYKTILNSELKNSFAQIKGRIVYKSLDPLLGDGKFGDGKNLLGKVLEQVRHEIRLNLKNYDAEMDREKYIDTLYNVYIVDIILHKMLFNKYKDIRDIPLGNLTKFINKYSKDYFSELPEKKIIIDMLKTQSVPDHIEKGAKNILYLINYILKENIEKYNTYVKKSRVSSLFEFFVEKTLSDNLPNLKFENYSYIIKKEFENVPFHKKVELQNRIFNMYEEDKLPQDIYDLMQEYFSNKFVPTSRDLEEIKNINLNLYINIDNVENINDDIYIDDDEDEFLIYDVEMNSRLMEDVSYNPKYSMYDPKYFNDMFTIQNYIFPTPIHYIYFKLFSLFIDTKESYKLITVKELKTKPTKPEDFKSIIFLEQIYNSVSKKHYDDNIKIFLEKGIDSKLQNKKIVELLLSIPSGNILWINNHPILGHPGKNLVGRYLMYKKTQIQKSLSEVTPQKDTEKILYTITKNDSFVKNWIAMKIIDNIKFLKLIMCYHNERTKVPNYKFTFEFVKLVNESFLYNCDILKSNHGTKTYKIPYHFERIITGYIKDTNSVKYIWNKIMTMLLVAIKNQKGDIDHFKNILQKINHITEENIPYNELGYSKNINCILISITNILNMLHDFNTLKGEKNLELTEMDIEYATKILLNDININKTCTVMNYKINNDLKKFHNNKKYKIDDDINILNSYFNPNRIIFTKQIEHYLTHKWRIYTDKNTIPSNIIEKLIHCVNQVSEYELTDVVKNNRINYFSTIKSKI